MITVYEHNFIMEDEHHNSATTTAATTTTSATLSDIDTPIDASEFEGLEEPEDLTEFTCFPSLPPEMRLKIWNVATHDVEPRVIEVMWSKSGRQYYTPSVVPGILQASQESRECGLRRYTRLDIATDSIMKIDLPGMRGSFVTYIDYNHDMVYVCNTTFRETRIGGELMSYFLSIFIPSSTGPDSLISTSKSSGIKTSRLQHVALDVMDFKARPFTHGILNALSQLSSLRTVNMVISDTCLQKPQSLMCLDSKPGLAHKELLRCKVRHSKELTLCRYQTQLSILDESVIPRAADRLSQTWKAFGMGETTRTSLSYVFIDIERDGVDEGAFGGFWSGC